MTAEETLIKHFFGYIIANGNNQVHQKIKGQPTIYFLLDLLLLGLNYEP